MDKEQKRRGRPKGSIGAKKAARLEAARREATRREAARLEATRLEAARLEAARLEAQAAAALHRSPPPPLIVTALRNVRMGNRIARAFAPHSPAAVRGRARAREQDNMNLIEAARHWHQRALQATDERDAAEVAAAAAAEVIVLPFDDLFK